MSIMIAAAEQSSPQSAQYMEQASQSSLGSRMAGFVKKSAAVLLMAASLASPVYAGTMHAQDAAPSAQTLVQQEQAGAAMMPGKAARAAYAANYSTTYENAPVAVATGAEINSFMPSLNLPPNRVYPVVEEVNDLLESRQIASLADTKMMPSQDGQIKADKLDVNSALQKIFQGWGNAARMAGKNANEMTRKDVMDVAKTLLESSRPGQVISPFEYIHSHRANVERGNEMFAGTPGVKASQVGSPFNAQMFDGVPMLANAAAGVRGAGQHAESQVAPR